MIRAFIEAEIFKLRRSRMEKISMLFMILMPIIWVGSVWWLEPDFTQYPGVLKLMGGSLMMLGIISLLLTAPSIGDEYEGGTVRIIVGRGVPRWLFVAGKGAALVTISFLNLLAFWLSILIVASLSHLGHAGSGVSLQLGIAAMFMSGLDTVAIATLTAAAYIGLGLTIGILTRSSSFAMLAGMGLVAADIYLSAFQETRTVFSNLSIMGNTGVLLNQLYFQMGGSDSYDTGAIVLETEPITAVFILLAYAIGGTLLAIFIFQRQELED